MSNTRIRLDMTTLDVVTVLSEGNPGALSVIMQCLQQGEAIDPAAGLGPLAALLNLDALGIYGPSIWVLYKDVCREDVTKFLGVLRATQLGIVSAREVQLAADARLSRNFPLDVDDLLLQVRATVPSFGAAAVSSPV